MTQQIRAAEIKRPKTNLTTNPAYQLDKIQRKTAFMGVFNKTYPGDAQKTLIKIALGALIPTAMISLGKRPSPKNAEQRKQRKLENTQMRAWQNNRAKAHLDQYVRLKKVPNANDPHFVLGLPVLHLRDALDVEHVIAMFSGAVLDDTVRQTVEDFFNAAVDQTFAADLSMRRAGLPGAITDTFKPALINVSYDFGETGVIVFLNFKITKTEAEALISQDWMEIRPVDLYPLFSMWVEAEYVTKNYSKSVTSLSRIAATLPKHSPDDERVDSFGIGINLDGMPIWLPKDCNNTQKYESMYAASSAGQGDLFALRTPTSQSTPKLPANIPILLDWVNYKFTYSNSVGKPVLMPLEHVRKCTASMAMNILRRPVPDKYFDRLAHFADVAGVSNSASAYGIQGQSTIQQYTLDLVTKMQAETAGFHLRYLDLTTDQEDPRFAGIRAYIAAVYNGIKNNLDAFYNIYAVSTTMEILGILGIVIHYGSDISQTRAEANTQQQKAKNQGVDPNWTPPDMPLITASFSKETGGMLPHQAKVRNLMKDSPENAVFSVDAGGGKSMLSITDILYEIKASRSAPYIIMCPSHLVANYVAELVEFTDGLVNVIPVTSYNISRTGYKRYEQILQTAPINTVLVVDYDALKYQGKAMGYGTSSVTVFPVIEMLRQFKPGYVMMDESHFLRNMQSARAKSVLSLVADIPKKRLASGTLNPDSPSDLAGQMAILDPSIFGSRETFNQTYGEDIRGNRVMRWRTKGPNSIGEVLPRLKETVVWAPAKRKEWACALPKRHDEFVSTELTPAQRQLYSAIFDDMIQQIRKSAETDKNAKKLLERLTGKKASREDEDDFGDLSDTSDEGDEAEDLLDDSEDVGPALQPYLADIERFVTDPSWHPYAKNGIILANGERIPPLTGDDLKSPKARALEYLLRKHFKNNKSKALVFVNYNQSAEALFEAMPDDLKAQGMLYTSSQKTELVNKFKTDNSVRWLIGIRKSLEVGLNLQVAGCLIRMEGVWNPGEQEQGDSRIARPYFGPGGDQREGLYFYTVVADRTIDITKAARLRAKMVALAKFENTGNPAYEEIEDIPIIPMNLETITTMNDFESNLAAYQRSMSQLKQVMQQEYDDYAKQIIAEGGFHFTQVQRAATPGGAAILSRVPYAQGTELYKADELGLIRVDNYLGMDLSGEDEDAGNDTGEEEEGADDDVVREQRQRIMGMRCHCEFGDGVIFGAAAIGKTHHVSRIHVRLDDGTTARGLHATNVFLVTRTETNSIDMRNKLAQAAGLQVTADITVPGTVIRQTKFTQKELREQERQRVLEQRRLQKKREKGQAPIAVSLQLQVVNGYLRFSYIGEDDRTTKALQALGFKLDQPHYYARIRSYRHLLKQVSIWAEAGFTVGDGEGNEALRLLHNELAQSGLQTHRHYTRLTNNSSFQNYLRKTWKPTANKKQLSMFALVTDGGADDPGVVKQAEKLGVDPAFAVAYLCLPFGGGHPGSKLAISSKYRAPGFTWYISTPAVSMYAGSLEGAKQIFKRLTEAGIVINNTDELNKVARSVKKIQLKQDNLDIETLEETPIKTRPTKEKVKPVVKVRKTR